MGITSVKMISSDMKTFTEDHKEVHICPIKGRTVIFEYNTCQEDCEQSDCPVKEYIETWRQA